MTRFLSYRVSRALQKNDLARVSLLPTSLFRFFLRARRNWYVSNAFELLSITRGRFFHRTFVKFKREFHLRLRFQRRGIFQAYFCRRAQITPFNTSITQARAISCRLIEATNYQCSGSAKARTRTMRSSSICLLCRAMFNNQGMFSSSIFVIVLCLIGRRKQIFRSRTSNGSFNFRLRPVNVRPTVCVSNEVSNDWGSKTWGNLSNVHFGTFCLLAFCRCDFRSDLRICLSSANGGNVTRIFSGSKGLIHPSVQVDIQRGNEANSILTRCVWCFFCTTSLFATNVRLSIKVDSNSAFSGTMI